MTLDRENHVSDLNYFYLLSRPPRTPTASKLAHAGSGRILRAFGRPTSRSSRCDWIACTVDALIVRPYLKFRDEEYSRGNFNVKAITDRYNRQKERRRIEARDAQDRADDLAFARQMSTTVGGVTLRSRRSNPFSNGFM